MISVNAKKKKVMLGGPGRGLQPSGDAQSNPEMLANCRQFFQFESWVPPLLTLETFLNFEYILQHTHLLIVTNDYYQKFIQ